MVRRKLNAAGVFVIIIALGEEKINDKIQKAFATTESRRTSDKVSTTRPAREKSQNPT